MDTHTFKDLIAWQKSMTLAKSVYDVCASLPKEEKYAPGDQMRRAAVSVPSNIAEGQKRLNKQEFIQFLDIALRSIAELETQLILASDLYNIDTNMSQKLCSESTALIVRLISALRTQNVELIRKE